MRDVYKKTPGGNRVPSGVLITICRILCDYTINRSFIAVLSGHTGYKRPDWEVTPLHNGGSVKALAFSILALSGPE